DGTYRIRFKSVEGEENAEAIPYTIKVEQDQRPTVVITKPKNTNLPADGVLSVEGHAEDDYGLTSLTLKMQVNKQELAGKLYRGQEWWARFKDAFLPQSLEYKDFVELDKVQTKSGEPFALEPGMELEYWLEATDACDYPPPGPQVGQSEHFKIKIQPPQNKSAEKQKEREQKKQEQKQHEEKQDQKLDLDDKAPRAVHNREQNPDPQPAPQDASVQPRDQEAKKLEERAKQLQEEIKRQEKQDNAAEAGKPKPQPGAHNNDRPDSAPKPPAD